MGRVKRAKVLQVFSRFDRWPTDTWKIWRLRPSLRCRGVGLGVRVEGPHTIKINGKKLWGDDLQ